MLTHALALFASQFVHKTTNYTSTHSLGGIRTHKTDLYQARGYNLIRHRGSEWHRAGRPGGLVELHLKTTAINASVGP